MLSDAELDPGDVTSLLPSSGMAVGIDDSMDYDEKSKNYCLHHKLTDGCRR
jgi:hypothetical protein